ncbi:RagB/SusD family nutrient uptake outer membrane protein, partial [Bacteroides sp. BFG-638]|nr:RagB/SusD family nutrient uptake outer membrane protein [Bacteroides sp. BFG-638]
VEQTKQVSRTYGKEVVDDMSKAMDEAADIFTLDSGQLWTRRHKSVALGLKAGIIYMPVHGVNLVLVWTVKKIRLKLQNTLRLQQQLLKKVIDESGRDLATTYADLFTRIGQLKKT